MRSSPTPEDLLRFRGPELPGRVHRHADCGHWVAEQAPEELLVPPTAFLASYRDGGTQGVGDRAEDPSTASTTVIEDTSIRPEGDPDV